MRISCKFAALLALLVLSDAGAQTVAHDAGSVAKRVDLVPGALWNDAGIGPDGNTVVFHADDGDVVLDSGRHRQHADDILRAMRGRPLRNRARTERRRARRLEPCAEGRARAPRPLARYGVP